MTDSMRERMATVVSDLIETDPRAALVLADIGAAQFREVLKRFPERAINLGIMEQTMVSVAAGYALEGFHPIVHSITPFVVERPYEQIKLDFCYQGLGGTLISIGASYDYGTDGMTHQGPGDVPILKTLPGMQVCVPGTADEFEALFRQTHGGGAPTYLRTSVQQNGASREVRFGKLHLEREGRAGLVVAVGPMLDRALAAAEAAVAASRTLDQTFANEGRAPLRFGLGPHVGEVEFGNVGTHDRLDFTAMGPAVNHASRLEALTKQVATPVLASAAFAARVSRPMRPMGRFALRGVAGEVEVYAP